MADLRESLNEIKYFLLDLDGTVYLGDKLIGKMDETLNEIRNAGKKIVFLTNNSSKSVDSYAEKLKRMKLFKNGDEICTSGIATARFLAEKRNGKKVYLLGTESLKREFKAEGIELTDKCDADICVLAYDTELTYKKLCLFTDNLRKGAEYIATHPDINCPSETEPVPDVGSCIEMIRCSTERVPDIIKGKPYTYFGEYLKNEYKSEENEFVMVGDRLYTDIAFGVNCGFHTIFVLSGEGTYDMLKTTEKKPEFVMDSLNEIIKYL